MRLSAFFVLLFCGLAAAAFAQLSSTELLDKIPSNDGGAFRCEDMINIVNHLRGLGKEKALSELRNYARQAGYGDTENVMLVCRVLFVNTNVWDANEVSLFGTPDLGYSTNRYRSPTGYGIPTNVYALFPLFPIALSEGVPFEVTAGYAGSGVPLAFAADCVKFCETLPLIPADLKKANYMAAARALIRSRSFQLLFPDADDRKRAEEMILMQTGVKITKNDGS